MECWFKTNNEKRGRPSGWRRLLTLFLCYLEADWNVNDDELQSEIGNTEKYMSHGIFHIRSLTPSSNIAKNKYNYID